MGTSLDDIRSFPEDITQDTGYQLPKVQCGELPDDFKYMRSIGSGVVEIRLKDSVGIYRVIYTVKLANTVYVLHVFTKKTQKTPQADIHIAKSRLKTLLQVIKNKEIPND